MGVETRPGPLRVTDEADVAHAAQALAAGAFVIHAFANLYALTTRGDARTVRAANEFKGRPAGQVGSVTTTPARLLSLFDLSRLTDELSPADVAGLVDELLCLGPCGFRAPAAARIADHLTVRDGTGQRWVQVIVPGYRCPANAFLAHALRVCGSDHLHITSANRSRHVTGAAEEPAHYRASALKAEFGGDPRLVLLEHADEGAALEAYPLHAPMSVTVLAFRRNRAAPAGRRALTVERHGSLPISVLREVLDTHEIDLSVPAGLRRLRQHVY